MELVILSGLQGSGKSSFFRERFEKTHLHVSKDLMRNVRDREARQRRLIADALAARRSVVVDNTNPTPAQRVPLIELGRAHGARIVGYFFDVPLKLCLARNAQRSGRARVPDVAIFTTAKRLVPPSVEEGYDALYTVRPDADGLRVERWPRSGPGPAPSSRRSHSRTIP